MTTDTSTAKKEKLFLKNPGKGDYTKNLEEEKKQSSKHSSSGWVKYFACASSVTGHLFWVKSVFSYAACECKPRSFKNVLPFRVFCLIQPPIKKSSETFKTKIWALLRNSDLWWVLLSSGCSSHLLVWHAEPLDYFLLEFSYVIASLQTSPL